MNGRNQKISKEELDFIRSLEDFDLTMLISEIHDHGWAIGKRLIPHMQEALKTRKQKGESHERQKEA